MTGGAGFIGSALCRYLVGELGDRVVIVDKLTYAGNLPSLDPISADANCRFEQLDISDGAAISQLLVEERIEGVIHLAAESHVDRSIGDPEPFIETNVAGTFRLLQTVLGYWRRLDRRRQATFRFHHVSTDEVFGDVGAESRERSDLRYRPSSPYSASKAASDHLVAAWHRTYGLPVVLSHSSNNYGPYQSPEKLIPFTILQALAERPVQIYGTGEQVRDWLFVEDHARALERVYASGRLGHSYPVSGRAERKNIEVVRSICKLLDGLRPRRGGGSHEELITFVADRPGHDHRYGMDPMKTESELGWSPRDNFERGLATTVNWYVSNLASWQSRLSSASGR